MKVKLSSPCTAMLMYEASKAQGHCEGGLIGEAAIETKIEIDDSAMTSKTENILSITSISELPLLNGVSSSKSNVMGWYKFCRRRSSRLTIREKSIHRRFSKLLGENGETPCQFISILLQEVWCPNKSTYGWKFSTYVLNNGRFEPCKVEVANLKASSCGTYMHYPIIHQQQRLPQVKSALLGLEEDLNIKDNNFPIVEGVRKAGEIVLGSLLDVVDTLKSTDEKLSQAYNEQDKLKLRIKELNGKLHYQAEPEIVTEITESSNANPDVTTCAHSSDDYSSESSESGSETVFGNPQKVTELISGLEFNNGNFVGNAGENSHGNTVANDNDLEAPPSYAEVTKCDPFDTLVDLAKANLSKNESSSGEEKRESERMKETNGEKSEEQLLKEFNDERPWSEKTRAGRKIN